MGLIHSRLAAAVIAEVPALKIFLSASGRKTPHPNAECNSDNERDPAHPHWYMMHPNRYFRLRVKTQDMADSKNPENNCRDL
jgi:hypothetical protein